MDAPLSQQEEFQPKEDTDRAKEYHSEADDDQSVSTYSDSTVSISGNYEQFDGTQDGVHRPSPHDLVAAGTVGDANSPDTAEKSHREYRHGVHAA